MSVLIPKALLVRVWENKLHAIEIDGLSDVHESVFSLLRSRGGKDMVRVIFDCNCGRRARGVEGRTKEKGGEDLGEEYVDS